jgi:hypothetical protein
MKTNYLIGVSGFGPFNVDIIVACFPAIITGAKFLHYLDYHINGDAIDLAHRLYSAP